MYREFYSEPDWQKSGEQECRLALIIMRLIRERHPDLPLCPSCDAENQKAAYAYVVSAAGNGAMCCYKIETFHAKPRTPDIAIKFDWDSPLDDSSRTWLELTGTGKKRMSPYTTYWIQQEKIEFIQQQPEWDILAICQYFDPDERFVIIKPDKVKPYNYGLKPVGKGHKEPMATFRDGDSEVIGYGLEFVADYIAAKLRARNPNNSSYPIITPVE